MKKTVNLLCGTSPGALYKRDQYAKAIANAGFIPVQNDHADYHIVCNEFLQRRWVELTNCTSTFRYAGDKLQNALALPSSFKYPFTSENVDDFKDKPFIVKQRYGSGATKSHVWSYTKHENKEAFYLFLKKYNCVDFFEQYQSNDNLRWKLGPYVFQEWVPPTSLVGYEHFFNDGNGTKKWMESPMDSFDTENYNVHARLMYEEHDFELPPGVFASVQYYLKDGEKYVFDLNTRSGGNWDFVYPYVAPNFYNVFFNNWLNGANDKYDFKPGYSLHKHKESDIFLSTDEQQLAYLKGGRYLHIHEN